MTIKEAVEEYNRINEKLKKIRGLSNDIATRHIGFAKPASEFFEVSPRELDQIGALLDEYAEILKAMLNRDFGGKDD